MNGAHSLVQTAAALGSRVCFANPGTTEMHLLSAFDAVPGMRVVLGLFEGVCTGAADGYARMTGAPGLTLLHLGPGLANGIANLHNARRARSPIVNLVGDHPAAHALCDPPLASDIECLARNVSSWVSTVRSAKALAPDFATAWAAALSAPRGVSTLIVPADCAWGDGDGPAPPARVRPFEAPVEASVTESARALREGSQVVLLLGGDALSTEGLAHAQRIARATGCRLACDTFVARLERGADLPALERLPYFPEQVRAFFEQSSHLVLAGARDPVAFFGYPGGESHPVPASCRRVELAGEAQSAVDALEALSDAVGAARHTGFGETGGRSFVGATVSQTGELPSGALDPGSLGRVVAALQPEGTILVDEAATSGLPYWLQSGRAPSHTYLGLTGGAIGQGLPCATGAALACPDRSVIALQADGSALYTAQALWTQARESLDVTTLICANREYRILRVELGRSGVRTPGPQTEGAISLREPAIDWVGLARSLGVPAARAATAEELARELRRALAEPGPHLVEALIA